MLADHHAVRKAGQGAGGQPAQAERGGVAAKGIVGGQGGGDFGRVLRHAVVNDAVPVAEGPAVEGTVLHGRQVVGRGFVAEAVAFVHRGPQDTGVGLPGHADGIAQAGGEKADLAAGHVEFIDAGATVFRRKPVVGDIGIGADGDIKPGGIGAGNEVAGPVAARFEAGEDARGAGLADGAGREVIGQQRIGVGDIERVANEGGSVGLVQAGEIGFLHLGHAIAIGIAHQGDAVGADPHGGGAFHRGMDRIVEGGIHAAGGEQCLGGQHVAIRQNGQRAGMVKAAGKGVHLEAGGGGGHVACGPATGGGHFQGGDALRFCGGDGGGGAQCGRAGVGAKAPHEDHHGPDHGHQVSDEFQHFMPSILRDHSQARR